MEELNKLIEELKDKKKDFDYAIMTGELSVPWLHSYQYLVGLFNDLIPDLESLRPHIRTEVDELKIEHSDKCRGYFRHLNLMFHAGSGDLKEGHEIAQTMRDEINKLVDQIRSLEGGAL